MRRLTDREKAAREIGYRRTRGNRWRNPSGRPVKHSTVVRAGAARVAASQRRVFSVPPSLSYAPPKVLIRYLEERLAQRPVVIERPTPPVERKVRVEEIEEGEVIWPADDPYNSLLPLAQRIADVLGVKIDEYPSRRAIDIPFDSPMDRAELLRFLRDNMPRPGDLRVFPRLHLGIYVTIETDDEEQADWIPLGQAEQGRVHWDNTLWNLRQHYRGDFVEVTGLTLRTFQNGRK